MCFAVVVFCFLFPYGIGKRRDSLGLNSRIGPLAVTVCVQPIKQHSFLFVFRQVSTGYCNSLRDLL